MYANRDLQVMDSILPLAAGNGVLEGVGVSVVLVERLLEFDCPGERMTSIGRRVKVKNPNRKPYFVWMN